jgi:hypothetical protein
METYAHKVALFGELAKSLKLLTDKQLEEALQKQRLLKAHDSLSRLGDVMVTMKLLRSDQVKSIRLEQEKRRSLRWVDQYGPT